MAKSKSDRVFEIQIDYGPDVPHGIHERTTGTLETIKQKYLALIPGFTIKKSGGELLAFATLGDSEAADGQPIGQLVEV